MGNIRYDTANSNNWESFWSGTFTAPPVPGGVSQIERYYPIPNITIPLSLDSELIAFYASSDSAQANWKYAGKVFQRIATGLSVGGNYETVAAVKKIYLNQISLLWYPIQYSSTYSLEINVPWWLRDITLNCWIYTGNIQDSYKGKLEEIKSELSTLHQDFDSQFSITHS